MEAGARPQDKSVDESTRAFMDSLNLHDYRLVEGNVTSGRELKRAIRSTLIGVKLQGH